MGVQSLLPLLAAAATAGAAAAAAASGRLPAVADPPAVSPPRPNLLYIVVDDLRTEIGAYGATWMSTPGIDGLAARGTLFPRAYTQVTVCSPSRTSFLTGMRPRRTRTWTIGPYFRNQSAAAASIVPLSAALIGVGYNATSVGKVWHPGTSSGGAAAPSVGGDDGAYGSWSGGRDPFSAAWECDAWLNGTGQSPASVSWPGGTGCVTPPDCEACLATFGIGGDFTRSWAAADCDDGCFVDGLIARRAVADLAWKAANPGAGPWAYFLGFKRPHLTLTGPAWAFAAYDNATTTLPAHPLPPPGMPEVAFFQNGEIGGASDVRHLLYTYTDADGNFTLVDEWKLREIKWAYRAVVTHMDRALGDVLAALDATGLANNTWVVFHGDHGWSLGENGEVAKQNLFEPAARVPLIIAPPRGAPGWAANTSFPGFVELVDLFPTVLDVLGVPRSAVPPGQLDGDTLVPALAARAAGGGAGAAAVAAAAAAAPAFAAAFTEISRGSTGGPTVHPPDGSWHGLSIRTADWRFTAWVPYNYSGAGPMWRAWDPSTGSPVELYDHRGDPAPGSGVWEDYDAMETVNVAGDPGNAAVVSEMVAMAQAAWPAPAA
jgi:iduronate 2-sulfatase